MNWNALEQIMLFLRCAFVNAVWHPVVVEQGSSQYWPHASWYTMILVLLCRSDVERSQLEPDIPRNSVVGIVTDCTFYYNRGLLLIIKA